MQKVLGRNIFYRHELNKHCMQSRSDVKVADGIESNLPQTLCSTLKTAFIQNGLAFLFPMLLISESL